MTKSIIKMHYLPFRYLAVETVAVAVVVVLVAVEVMVVLPAAMTEAGIVEEETPEDTEAGTEDEVVVEVEM